MTETDITESTVVGRWPVGPRTTDALLAVLVTALAVITLVVESSGDGTSLGPSVAVAILAGGSLAARRIFPIPVLLVAVAGRLFVTWDLGNELALAPAAAVALYTVARHGDRLVGLLTASSAAAVMGLVSAAFGDEAFLLELLGEAGQGFLPIAAGDAVRSRAERLRDLIDSEAEARVQAERLRIARDLHDVVAHGLSTIAIQSGVAAHLLDRDPGQAREALDVINATGKASLEELRTMVGVLRATDADLLRPAPTDPNDIGNVIAGARRSGVDVSLRTSGVFPADAGDAIVVAVNRIVQEALTNVARHAGAVPATVGIDHLDDQVVVEIRNQPAIVPRDVVASTGVGIIGMRERAESLGGTLDAARTTDGCYRVLATIPYSRR